MLDKKHIHHPLIEQWAMKHFELEADIRKAVEAMTEPELDRLRGAVDSLTTTNCWFAEYDVRLLVYNEIARREAKKKMTRKVK